MVVESRAYRLCSRSTPIGSRAYSGRAMRDQDLREIGEDPPIMRFVRIGQRRARHLAAESQVVQLALHRTQTGLDVAQTFPIGQLREGHGQILIPAGKSAQPDVALIALDATAKLPVGKEADQLRKDGAALIHEPLSAVPAAQTSRSDDFKSRQARNRLNSLSARHLLVGSPCFSRTAVNADKDTFNAFTFVASLSLSGVVGCFALDCRINRPQKLARYAALYADNVIAPIELTNPHKHQRPHGPKQEDDFRYHMTGTVLALLEMAPAIKASLISITTPELHFCAACAANASRRIQRINAAAQKLAEAKRRHFSVCCERLAPIPILHVHGPAEYCEHEDFFRVYRQTPKWLNTKLGKHMLGISLPPSVLKQSGIVDSLFRDVAWQVTLQEYLGLQYKAKTVTSNPGELALLSRLNPAHGVHSRATAALSQITHALPLMEEISLTKAIQLRNAGE